MARIFLCHASEDKAQVREVYHRLRAIDGFEPWLDEEDLLPGQDWDYEIKRALKTSDFILIFFSRSLVARRGYVQREMKLALDAWQDVPEGTIHTIPVLIDACDVPESFRRYQWVKLSEPNGFDRIVRAIRGESHRTPSERATKPETDTPRQPYKIGQQDTKLPLWRRISILVPVIAVLIAGSGSLAYYMTSSTKYILSAKNRDGLDIPVKKNQVFIIEAKGSIHTNIHGNVGVCDERTGPNGIRDCKYNEEKRERLHGLPFMALIGKFDGVQHFYIGECRKVKFENDGVLTLLINDWGHKDNGGKFEIDLKRSSENGKDLCKDKSIVPELVNIVKF